MTRPFNLLEEEWITAVDSSGVERDVSIRDVFDPDQHLLNLSGEVPTQAFAILRMLIAITTHAYDLRREDQWHRLVDSGIDVARINAYLDSWADRFDLFHETTPFMQVGGLHTSKGEASALDKLVADVPNGAKLFTTRQERSLRSISPGEAARWLVHAQSFDPAGIRSAAVGDPQTKGGRGYPFGVAWAGQLGGVVIHGGSLLQTIALNCTILDGDDTDVPVWASSPLDQTRQDYAERPTPGVLRLLTWQSRRIRLVGGIEGVTGVVLCQGDKMTPQNRQDREPMSAWRLSAPQSQKAHAVTYMPLKHDPSRAFWRSLPHVVEREGPKDDKWGVERWLPPATVTQLNEFSDLDDDLPDRVRLQAIGITYGSNESVIDEIVDDTVSLALSVLRAQSPEIGQLIADAAEDAEKAVWALGHLAGDLAMAAGESGDAAGKAAQEAAQVEAWAGLNQLAGEWISQLTDKSERATSLTAWQKQVRDLLEGVGRRLIEGAPDQAVRGRAVGVDARRRWVDASIAQHRFRRELNATLTYTVAQPDASEDPTKRADSEEKSA